MAVEIDPRERQDIQSRRPGPLATTDHDATFWHEGRTTEVLHKRPMLAGDQQYTSSHRIRERRAYRIRRFARLFRFALSPLDRRRFSWRASSV